MDNMWFKFADMKEAKEVNKKLNPLIEETLFGRGVIAAPNM